MINIKPTEMNPTPINKIFFMKPFFRSHDVEGSFDYHYYKDEKNIV